MRARAIWLGICLTVVSCRGALQDGGSDGGAGTTGDAGNTGTTGAAGTTGVAGTSGVAGAAGGAGGVGGTGGAGGIAMCTPSGNSGGFFVFDPSGATPVKSGAAAVTVVSVDDCDVVDCGLSGRTGVLRYVLAAAGGERWMLFSYSFSLPADLVKVGDAVDLGVVVTDIGNSINTLHHQTITLHRADALILFESNLPSDLAADGIKAGASATAVCKQDACFTEYLTNVSAGADSAVVAPGATVHLGGFSILVYGTTVPGPCDGQGATSLAGFSSP